jgi:RNA:NAD 2'-phosphotransferase (TPT1/KptA family)
MSDLIKISKIMSFILRHSKIETDIDGYIDINILLNHPDFKKYKISFDIIKYIVDNDNKSRYKLSDDNKYIRANQGHSKHKNVEIGTTIESDILFAYHGTSKKNSQIIMKYGLSRMNRQHIHMVENIKNVLYYSEIIIQIDIKKAQELEIIFITSDNNYILSTGNNNNIIPPECLSIKSI